MLGGFALLLGGFALLLGGFARLPLVVACFLGSFRGGGPEARPRAVVGDAEPSAVVHDDDPGAELARVGGAVAREDAFEFVLRDTPPDLEAIRSTEGGDGRTKAQRVEDPKLACAARGVALGLVEVVDVGRVLAHDLDREARRFAPRLPEAEAGGVGRERGLDEVYVRVDAHGGVLAVPADGEVAPGGGVEALCGDAVLEHQHELARILVLKDRLRHVVLVVEYPAVGARGELVHHFRRGRSRALSHGG